MSCEKGGPLALTVTNVLVDTFKIRAKVFMGAKNFLDAQSPVR